MNRHNAPARRQCVMGVTLALPLSLSRLLRLSLNNASDRLHQGCARETGCGLPVRPALCYGQQLRWEHQSCPDRRGAGGQSRFRIHFRIVHRARTCIRGTLSCRLVRARTHDPLAGLLARLHCAQPTCTAGSSRLLLAARTPAGPRYRRGWLGVATAGLLLAGSARKCRPTHRRKQTGCSCARTTRRGGARGGRDRRTLQERRHAGSKNSGFTVAGEVSSRATSARMRSTNL